MTQPAITVFETLTLLTPYDIADLQKVRVGTKDGDGGYVMLDRFSPNQKIFSYGIGGTVDFELEFADRGHDVFMFDHTIEKLPQSHSRFAYSKEGVAGTDQPDASLYSISHHVARYSIDETNMILKMDVEGAEWDALGAATPNLLCRFEQITLEAHDFWRLSDPGFRESVAAVLEKLARDFTLFHVHSNNYADLCFVDGLVVCPVIELSYVRSDLVRRLPTATVYPTPLDPPNNPRVRDHLLLFYPFFPRALDAGVGTGMINSVYNRIEMNLKRANGQ